jgi:hypothetical protein
MGTFSSTSTFIGSVGNLTGKSTKNGIVLGVKKTKNKINPVSGKLIIENNHEMSEIWKYAKQIHDNLIPNYLFQSFKKPTSFGRLVAAIKKEQLTDIVHPRGFRDVFAGDTFMYAVLNISPIHRKLINVYKGDWDINWTSGTDELILNIGSFNENQLMFIPKGATHYRFFFCGQFASRFLYDFYNKIWVANIPQYNGFFAHGKSPLFDVNIDGNFGISVVAKFPDIVIYNMDSALLPAVGIQFFQRVGAFFNPMIEGMASQLCKWQ